MYEANITFRRHHDSVTRSMFLVVGNDQSIFSERSTSLFLHPLENLKSLLFLFLEKFHQEIIPDLKYFSHIYNPDDTLKDRL